MARNLEASIRIEMNETDAPLSSSSDQAEAISSGHFRLVLDGAKSLDSHRALYRVDGEVGRFEFETFDVRDTHGRTHWHVLC